MKANLFLAALVLVGTSAFANGPGSPRLAVISQTNPGMFKIIYEKNGVISNVRMTILNHENEIVFTETTKNVDGFIRSVNFTQMDPGEYTVEVADKSGKQIQKVVYGEIAPIQNVHVSKISDEGKYLLSVTNSGKNRINVQIFDGTNNLVHNESTTINGNYGLVYNLKAVEGVPTFEISDKTGVIHTVKY